MYGEQQSQQTLFPTRKVERRRLSCESWRVGKFRQIAEYLLDFRAFPARGLERGRLWTGRPVLQAVLAVLRPVLPVSQMVRMWYSRDLWRRSRASWLVNSRPDSAR